MSKQCAVCINPNRAKIEQALINGDSIREISKQYGLNPNSVFSHKKNHLKLSTTQEILPSVSDGSKPQSVIDMLATLIDESQAILIKAKERNDDRLALQAIKMMQDVCLRVLEVRPEKSQQAQSLSEFCRIAVKKGLLTTRQIMEISKEIPTDIKKDNFRPVFIVWPD